MKVDSYKAFDKISWEFLLLVLEEMNCPSKWVQLLH